MDTTARVLRTTRLLNRAGGLISSNSNNKTKNPRPNDSNLEIEYYYTVPNSSGNTSRITILPMKRSIHGHTQEDDDLIN